jgi:hypothetical protein
MTHDPQPLSGRDTIQAGRDVIQVGGDYVGGDTIAGNKIVYNYPVAPAPDTERERRNRTVMLQKVHDFWVKGVLENSLHKAALIDLGMGLCDQGDLAGARMYLEQAEVVYRNVAACQTACLSSRQTRYPDQEVQTNA